MNVSAGLAGNGDLLVLASGWTLRPPVPDPLPVFPHDGYTPPAGTEFGDATAPATWVCRSTDGGATWTHVETVSVPEGADYFIPFGDITDAGDGTLFTTCYSTKAVWLLVSRDDGLTWPEYRLISEGYNETDILSLGGGNWLALARCATASGMGLFRSEDGGQTWVLQETVTLPAQHPGHLLRLRDGRLLMSFGVRNPGLHGVGVRLSDDEGRTWGIPRVLVQYDAHADGGYPSSAELEDGTIVTAYYASNTEHHQRYHMGVVRWRDET